MYDNIELYFNLLKHYGSGCGYYPKTSKSVLIVHPDNLETGNQFGLCHGFKVFTSEWYFGGFIGDDKSKLDWIQDRTLTWENNIIKIIETVEKYTQESYDAVVHVIQPEWISLQHVTKKWDTRLQERRCFFRKHFSLPPLRKIEIYPIHHRNLK